ncbi:helix-turn-helix transcriptional regulator [Streptomyces sp. NPDC058662]|uniref:helix-turn-helix transcriptional regulator n=1 Tax=Streptomyces sp. NPDC058662 TaxID=3346583 RepID=UPI00365C28EC
MLLSLGLTERSDALYRLILKRPDLAVTDVAAELGLPDDEVREDLAELTELSLLTPSWRTGGQLRAVNPKAALDSLLAHQQAEIAQRHRVLAESQAAASQLLSRYAEFHPAQPTNEAERFQGVDAVRAKLAVLSSRTRRESISFHPGGPVPASQFKASEPLTEDLIARGVKIRTIYQDSIRNDVASLDHARWLTERGGEVRTVPALPMRMVISDGESALMPIDPTDSAQGAVLLREPGAVAAFCALFEAVWETATPFGAPPRRRLDDPGSQPRELLRLLALGYTDEAAARRLGISLRSERRLISELMEKLDAQSRFQLGQRAVEHGLL